MLSRRCAMKVKVSTEPEVIRGDKRVSNCFTDVGFTSDIHYIYIYIDTYVYIYIYILDEKCI